MIIELISFGFKYNSPPNTNYLIDVRFLNNPYYVDNLKPLTGLDKDVIDFFHSDLKVSDFLEKLKIWIAYIIEANITANKESIKIAIGCTGGQHRSPYIVEQLAQYITNNSPNITKLTVYHTELTNYNNSV